MADGQYPGEHDASGPTRISVVVVSYNVQPLLRRCLDSIAAATSEVVVVDNGSSDGSAELVRERFPGIRLIALSENRGFSAAVNEGVGQTTGDAVLLLNPDAELTAGALAKLTRLSRERPSVWAIGCRQVDERGRFQLSCGPGPWLSLDLVRRWTQRALDGGNDRLGRAIDWLLRRPMPVPWVAGSCLLVQREAFDRVGGFDEGFFLFFEDIDFCLRLRAAGGQVWYEPRATVIHARGASARIDPARAARAYRQSQLRFWEKHRGLWARRVVSLYQRLRGLAPNQAT